MRYSRENRLWFPAGERLTSTFKEVLIIKQTKDSSEEFETTYKRTLEPFVCFECSIINYFPRNFNKYLVYCRDISLEGCSLKTLSKDDLKGLPQLELLYLGGNEISELQEDLFEYTSNIRALSFAENQLTTIGKKLLHPLKRLIFANFRGNIVIDAIFDEGFDKKIQIPSACVSLNELNEMIGRLSSSSTPTKNIKKMEPKASCEILSTCHFKKVSELHSLRDFTINLKGENFQLHRFVLAAFSPVFARMFESNPEAKEMDLIDISTVVFRTIIDYMYKNELPVNHPDLIGLYMAARHLELKDLQDFSETQIHSRTNASNAYEILVFSNKIDSKKLKDKAFDVIKEMFPGQSLKEEIKHQPEKIKKVIDAKRQIDKLMTEMRKDIESLTVVDSQ